MNTSDTSTAQLARRLGELEFSVQEIRFQHMVKVDAMSHGVSVLYAQQQQLQHELTGFRAEATMHLTALKTDMTEVKTDVAVLKTDVGTLKTDVGTLKTDVGTLKTDVGTLKTDVGTLKTDVGTLKTEQARQGAQLDEVLRILRAQN